MIHAEVAGSGPTLVLIHGWGLNGAVWQELLPALADRRRVVAVDLPGHGASPLHCRFELDLLVSAVAEAAGDDAAWLGWSLGGLVALEAAARGLARHLYLVAGTPCFVQRPGWPHAMEPELLENFASALVNDYEATLLRFVALQARGSDRQREEIRSLRERLFQHGRPDPAALAGGLALLRDCDLRDRLGRIACPADIVHGANDRLAPPEAGRATAAALAGARLHLIEGAGHAPFLSHPEPFLRLLESDR